MEAGELTAGGTADSPDSPGQDESVKMEMKKNQIQSNKELKMKMTKRRRRNE